MNLDHYTSQHKVMHTHWHRKRSQPHTLWRRARVARTLDVRKTGSLCLCRNIHQTTLSLLLWWEPAKYNESPTMDALLRINTAKQALKQAEREYCTNSHALTALPQDVWVEAGEEQPTDIKDSCLYMSYCRLYYPHPGKNKWKLWNYVTAGRAASTQVSFLEEVEHQNIKSKWFGEAKLISFLNCSHSRHQLRARTEGWRKARR